MRYLEVVGVLYAYWLAFGALLMLFHQDRLLGKEPSGGLSRVVEAEQEGDGWLLVNG